MVRTFLCVVLASVLCMPAAARPARIVSLNLCTDILLYELADRSQIASLSFLAADPNLSIIAGKLGDIPINYGRAEEVRLLDPDLVLAGDFGAQFAVSILKEHGYHVVQLAAAMRAADIVPAIETIGCRNRTASARRRKSFRGPRGAGAARGDPSRGTSERGDLPAARVCPPAAPASPTIS